MRVSGASGRLSDRGENAGALVAGIGQRGKPVGGGSEWYAPPFHTADGDIFEQSRAEVALQEETARRPEAVTAGTAGEAAP